MKKLLILVVLVGAFLTIGYGLNNSNKTSNKTEKQVNNDEEMIKEA